MLSVQCVVCNVQYVVLSDQCPVFSVQCAVCSIQSAVLSLQVWCGGQFCLLGQVFPAKNTEGFPPSSSGPGSSRYGRYGMV